MSKIQRDLFKIENHDHADKSFQITGPHSYDGGLVLSVDYDDVDHDRVDEQALKLVKILNEHWLDYDGRDSVTQK
jgi:hypothetical protein